MNLHPTPRWRHNLILAFMAASLLAGSDALLAADKEKDPGATEYDSLLADLGNSDYDVRDAASQRLLADNSVSLETLSKLYRFAPTPEQRHRILDAARHHYIRMLCEQQFPGQRSGALGVVQSVITPEDLPEPFNETPAARVVETLPGFPAYVKLKPGDLIIAVDGRTLPDNIDPAALPAVFGERITSHPQGKTINLAVLRGGQRIDVPVTLSSSDAIRNLYGRSDRRLQLRFRWKWYKFRDAMVDEADTNDEKPLPIDVRRAAEPE